MKCYIYVLKDPDTLEIKYVGKTKTPLLVRLAGHISDTKNSPKSQWINTLLDSDKMPLIEAIEETTVENSCAREAYWINHYREKLTGLFNRTVGGFREKAKRRYKYGEKMVMVGIRVPVSKIDLYKEFVKGEIANWAKDPSKS